MSELIQTRLLAFPSFANKQPKINAFALPSKELFVFAGLVDLVEHDELLAAVLAHEMAHVTQRHAVENVSRLLRCFLPFALSTRRADFVFSFLFKSLE